MKFGTLITTIALPLTLVTTQATFANAAQQRWYVDEPTRSIFVSNCQECKADAQITFTCPTVDKMIDIVVPALSTVETADQEFNHIVFDFFGREYVYDANLVPSAKAGEVFPKANLELNDPVLKIMQKGSSVMMQFFDKKTKLTLRGSQNAIAAFQRICKKPLAPVIIEPEVASQPSIENQPSAKPAEGIVKVPAIDVINKADIIIEPEPIGEPVANTPNVQKSIVAEPKAQETSKTKAPAKLSNQKWYVKQSQGSRRNTMLNYGAPQSDKPQISANCKSPNTSQVEVTITSDFGHHRTGDQVMVDFIVDESIATYNGVVFDKDTNGDSVKFTVARDNPIWEKISKAKHVTFGSRDSEIQTINGIAGASAINEFLLACSANR